MNDIRCFQHCTQQYNILCVNIPDQCPVCGQNVLGSGLRIPPYVIPSPFTSSVSTQHSMLIKPTEGDFLTDFTNESNLHVGLSDSRGRVYEFDERGVTIGGSNWTCCLNVELVLEYDDVKPRWDESLKRFIDGRLWKAEYYDDIRHNCFDFVIGFLRYIGLDRVYSCLIDRTLFCKEIIVPQTEKVGKYISLYRDVVTNGCVVKPT